MNLSETQYERINQFLDGNMSVEQMELFEKELITNPVMRQQLDFEQAVRDSFHFKQLPAQTTVAPKLINIKPRSTFLSKKWLAVAAAACVMGILITVAIVKPVEKAAPVVTKNEGAGKPLNPDSQTLHIALKTDSPLVKNFASLYTAYFEMDDLPDNYPIALADAFTGYENGEYKKIINLDLANLPETRGADDEPNTLLLGHYYKGLALLKTNNAPEAMRQLEWVAANDTGNILTQKATWYMALAQVKNNENLAAIKLLKKIAATKSSYKIKARQLLAELE